MSRLNLLDFLLSYCNICMIRFSMVPFYTLLETTDSPPQPPPPPENHVIPQTLAIAIPGSRLIGLARVTVVTRFFFVVSNDVAEISAKSCQPSSCNQAFSQCRVSNYKNCRQ